MSRLVEIKRNAVTLIARNGFGAMSLRDLARASGLQVGSVYAHYKSKNSLLLEVLVDHLEELISAWQENDCRKKGPKLRLSAFVTTYVEFHAANTEQCVILESDTRSLDDEGRETVAALQAQYENQLAAILREGVKTGVFLVPDLAFSVTTLLSMLRGICHRYCSDPQHGVGHVVSHATMMAFAIAGAR